MSIVGHEISLDYYFAVDNLAPLLRHDQDAIPAEPLRITALRTAVEPETVQIGACNDLFGEGKGHLLERMWETALGGVARRLGEPNPGRRATVRAPPPRRATSSVARAPGDQNRARTRRSGL